MSEKLNIIWTTDNAETAINMIAMYATFAKKNKQFDEVCVIIWGGSNILIKKDSSIQNAIKEMISAGIIVRGCRSCAENMGTTELLESLGVDVDYMGRPLTAILKEKEYLLTI